jgi:hypothetical protein
MTDFEGGALLLLAFACSFLWRIGSKIRNAALAQERIADALEGIQDHLDARP